MLSNQKQRTNFSNSNEVDVSHLFSETRINRKIKVFQNEHTYDIQPTVKNNWISIAFRGFEKLAKSKEKIKTFASIGTSLGIDGIGANEIFKPKEIILTDLHENVLPLVKINFLNNLGENKPEKFLVLKGNLCEPLKRKKIKADLIYANLPNIPFKGNKEKIFEGIKTSSFFVSQKNVPKKFEKFLLAHQYLFLQDAKNSLANNGTILLNIGARMPFSVFEELFKETGYRIDEITTAFKMQTEAEEMLKGYAEAEKEYRVKFDFYPYEKTLIFISENSVEEKKLKNSVKKFRISASEAYKLHKKGKKIGHIAHLFHAKLQG